MGAKTQKNDVVRSQAEKKGLCHTRPIRHKPVARNQKKERGTKNEVFRGRGQRGGRSEALSRSCVPLWLHAARFKGGASKANWLGHSKSMPKDQVKKARCGAKKEGNVPVITLGFPTGLWEGISRTKSVKGSPSA